MRKTLSYTFSLKYLSGFISVKKQRGRGAAMDLVLHVYLRDLGDLGGRIDIARSGNARWWRWGSCSQ
jgi:hypothetical protein